MVLALTLLVAATIGCSGVLLRRRQNQEMGEYRMSLTNHDNTVYTANVTIGGQTLPVIYDTGSFRVVVTSSLCKSCVEDSILVYDGSKSTGYRATSGGSIRIVYGSGPIEAQESYDSMRLGNSSSPYSTQEAKFFQVSKTDGDNWKPNMYNPKGAYRGMVGLALGATVLDTFGITRFGVCLRRDSKNAPGVLTFQPQLPQGHFRPFVVDGYDHWSVSMGYFGADGLNVQNPCSSGCAAIIDSGTAVIAVPPPAFPVVNKLRDMIANLMDCQDLSSLPTLQFEFDGKMLELPPHAYVVNDNGACTHAFMQMDHMSHMGPVFIMGMNFLRYYHAIYDTEHKIIHMAESPPNCEVSSSTLSLAKLAQASRVANYTQPTRVFGGVDYTPLAAKRADLVLPEWAVSGPKEMML